MCVNCRDAKRVELCARRGRKRVAKLLDVVEGREDYRNRGRNVTHDSRKTPTFTSGRAFTTFTHNNSVEALF